MAKNPSAVEETPVRSLGQEDPLEKGMATHSSILAWRWTEFGGLQSMGVTKSQTWLSDWVTTTKYIYHIFFILSSVDGHLGCFHALVVGNSPAVNTGMHVSFQIKFSPDICPGVGLLDHTVILFFSFFLRNFILFSTVTVPIYIPIKSL